MTNREFYKAIASNEELTQELRDFANSAIDKLDTSLEKRKAKPSKTAVSNAPLVERIVTEVLKEDVPMTASDVAACFEDMKVQKASALLRIAVKEGRAAAADVKVKGKGVQKGYTLA